jgi:hypothetical protein
LRQRDWAKTPDALWDASAMAALDAIETHDALAASTS